MDGGGQNLLAWNVVDAASDIAVDRNAKRTHSARLVFMEPNEGSADGVLPQVKMIIHQSQNPLPDEATCSLEIMGARHALHQKVDGDRGLHHECESNQFSESLIIVPIVEVLWTDAVQKFREIGRLVDARLSAARDDDLGYHQRF